MRVLIRECPDRERHCARGGRAPDSVALGTSTMPVRGAMTRLITERALDPLPNRGLKVPVLTDEDAKDVLRARFVLEGLAVMELLPGDHGSARFVHDHHAAIITALRKRAPKEGSAALEKGLQDSCRLEGFEIQCVA
jgi:DNA-binding GntR family transcriptional regulator